MPLSDVSFNPSPGSPSWASAALFVHRPGGLNSNLVDTVYVDQPANSQFVRSSLAWQGANATGNETVQLQLWAALFNISLSTKLFFPGFGGNSGVQLPLPLGSASGADSFNREWRPTTQDIRDLSAQLPGGAISQGEAHSCLFANVFVAEDNGQPGIGAKLSSPNDPAFVPATNKRHAQRNTTIKAVPPMVLTTMLWAGNPDPEKGHDYVFEVVETDPRLLTVVEVGQIAAAVPWIEAPAVRVPIFRDFTPRALPGLIRRAPAGVLDLVRPTRHSEAELRRGIGGLVAHVGGSRLPLLAPKGPLQDVALEIDGGNVGPRQTIGMEPDEARAVQLHLELPREERVVRVFDAVQRDKKGAVLDGARIIAITAPDGVK